MPGVVFSNNEPSVSSYLCHLRKSPSPQMRQGDARFEEIYKASG